jgi:serine/threonine protein kinase/WD40 repeat protein
MSDDAEKIYVDLLAACHEAVLEGGSHASAASLPPDVTNELAERIQQRLYCLELLEQFRRDSSTAAREGATQNTPSWLSSAGQETLDEVDDEFTLERLGHFRLLHELGRGGHGIVFLAQDEALGRCVALKVPRPECLLSKPMRRRFVREAQAAARLAHPHLLTVFESGEDGPLCYLASAYCTGPTLSAWRQAHAGPVPERLAARIVSVLADGAHYAHDRGVLHRDIKPGNVFLDATPQGFVQVAEEGGSLCVPCCFAAWHSCTCVVVARTGATMPRGKAAQLCHAAKLGLARIDEDAHDATRTGAIVGTPAYMAPEQALGDRAAIGAATDVYGLGTILFELLSGLAPFRGRTDAEILKKVFNDEVPHVRSLRRDVSADLGAICAKCLERNPGERYGSAADLNRFLRDESTLARPLPNRERLLRWARKRPAIAASVLLAVAATLSVLAGSLLVSQRLARLVREKDQESQRAYGALELAGRREAEALSSAYPADMQSAFDAWSAGQYETAERLLLRYQHSDGRADRREFTWYYLRNLMAESPIICRCEGGARAVAISRDDRWIAVAGFDGVIRLLDGRTYALVKELRGHAPEGVETMTFSPDGAELISTGNESLVRRWAIPSGESLEPFRGAAGWNAKVVYSPQSTYVAAAGSEKTIYVWLGHDLSLVRQLKGHADTIRGLVFADDSTIYSSSEDGDIRRWELRPAKNPPALVDGRQDNPTGSNVMALVRHPTIDVICGITRDGQLIEWHTHAPQGHLTNDDLPRLISPRAMAISPRGVLAVGDAKGGVHLRFPEPQSDGTMRTRYGQSRRVSDLAAANSGDFVLSAAADGTVRRQLLPRIVNSRWLFAGGISALLEHRRGVLLSLKVKGRINIYDHDRREVLATIEVPPFALPRLAPQSQGVIVATQEGLVSLYDWSTGLPRWQMQGPAAVQSMAVDSQERHVAAACHDTVAIRDLATGAEVRQLEHPGEVRVVAFVGQTSVLATAGAEGIVRLWDVGTGQILSEQRVSNATVSHLSFTVDGQRCGTEGENVCRVWELKTWKLLGTISCSQQLEWFALPGHGETLVVKQNGDISFHRVSDGARLLDLTRHYQTQVMALSDDGQTIYTQVDELLDQLDGTPADLVPSPGVDRGR